MQDFFIFGVLVNEGCKKRQHKEAPKLNDRELMRLLREEEENGLAVMDKLYGKLLYHIAAGILGSRYEDIEECVNDTYFKFWRKLDTYDINKASIKTYLKVIVRNTAINKLRDIGKREEGLMDYELSDVAATYVDESQNVEEHMVNKEDVRKLNDVVAGFCSRDKELVIRKFFYLQSSKEISGAMDMTVTAVDCRISRLRARIKREFEVNL